MWHWTRKMTLCVRRKRVNVKGAVFILTEKKKSKKKHEQTRHKKERKIDLRANNQTMKQADESRNDQKKHK